MTHRLLFAVGGTGGHLFPAMGLAQKLLKRDPSLKVLFAGGGAKQGSSLENMFSYQHVSSAPLSLGSPWKMIKNGARLARGILQARALLHKYAPSLVIGFGSHYAFPLLLAARAMKIPYILHEQNRIPGRVVRFFSKKALFTGIHFPVPEGYLKGKTRSVGMPLREGYFRGAIERSKALNAFGMECGKQTVLIFGGSQGAQGINRWVSHSLENRKGAPFQVIHLTGSLQESERLKALYQARGISACVREHESQMQTAWEIADCVIGRAGASSIAEQIAYEVPGILIPYPHAMDNHQEHNADFFVDVVGGGKKYTEVDMGKKDLFSSLEQLDVEKFRKNIARFKQVVESQDFALEILTHLDAKNA